MSVLTPACTITLPLPALLLRVPALSLKDGQHLWDAASMGITCAKPLLSTRLGQEAALLQIGKLRLHKGRFWSHVGLGMCLCLLGQAKDPPTVHGCSGNSGKVSKGVQWNF